MSAGGVAVLQRGNGVAWMHRGCVAMLQQGFAFDYQGVLRLGE